MHSHHSHSGAFCKHADQRTTPKSMIENAIKKGFSHYHLTEHIPRSKNTHLYPEEIEEDITPNQLEKTFEEYLVEAKRCSKEFKQIEVLVGAELENVDGRTMEELNFVEGILKDPQSGQWLIDYVIGSVHHVYEIPIDFDKSTFEKALRHIFELNTSQIIEQNEILQGNDRIRAHLLLILAYLEAQFSLIQKFQPEVIGHFDLCRLFESSTPMTLAGKDRIPVELKDLLESVDQAVRRNVQEAVKYGALFELNSASVRKGWPTPYPGEDVLDIILSYEGKLCLSDDAHSHEQIGLNYQKSFEYLSRKGVPYVWFLTKKTGDGQRVAFTRGTMAEKTSISDLKQFLQNLDSSQN